IGCGQRTFDRLRLRYQALLLIDGWSCASFNQESLKSRLRAAFFMENVKACRFWGDADGAG
ncbi:MAG: hypothetical protein Q7J71_02000, partial [Polaromonas sp.]|nr:hypothetical protein [Polaromonas sp.]